MSLLSSFPSLSFDFLTQRRRKKKEEESGQDALVSRSLQGTSCTDRHLNWHLTWTVSRSRTPGLAPARAPAPAAPAPPLAPPPAPPPTRARPTPSARPRRRPPHPAPTTRQQALLGSGSATAASRRSSLPAPTPMNSVSRPVPSFSTNEAKVFQTRSRCAEEVGCGERGGVRLPVPRPGRGRGCEGG
jgi:hypothetical protein